VPVDYDASLKFLGRRQYTIAVRIQELQNLIVGLPAAPILERTYPHAGRIIVPQTVRDLDFTMNRIVATNQATDESDNDRWGRKVSLEIVVACEES